MKGLILCAGKGTRLYPFSLSIPKVLLPVANKPIVHYSIEKLVELNIREIGIVIDPRYQPLFARQVGSGERWNARITYIYQTDANGIADAVKQAAGFIADDPFLLLLGDNVIEQSLACLQNSVQHQRHDAAILLGRVATPRDYGIAEIADGRIVGLEEKPVHPKSNLAVLGAYAFRRPIFQAVGQIPPSGRGEYEITDAIQWMIRQGYSIDHWMTEKRFSDVGKPERWLEANRWMLDRLHQTEATKETGFAGCRIIPPVQIGEGCQMKDCVIGPYVSIGPHVQLEGCHIADSIVLERTNLFRQTLQHAIVSSHLIVQLPLE